LGRWRYIDGGYRRSSENADLAAGYGRVLVLSPLGGRTRAPLDWGMHLAAQVDELRARGSRVETVLPDSDSRNALGSNLMDLSTRPPAARAGYDQGRAHTEAINGRLEHLRGSALGFRNLTNYIARSLLEVGGFRPRVHPRLR
jgi:NTE family protein